MTATPSMPAAILGLALLAIGAGGCAVNPATGERAFTGGFSTAREVETGRRLHPMILARMGGAVGDRALARYVDSIGQLLARTGERTDIEYSFTVLDSDIVNAFATPGGYIYVSRGLLALADDEAELAAVLAHELGHVTALHHARRQGQTLLANLGLLAAGAVAGAVAPGNERSIMDFGQIAATGVLRGFSREHEYQADSLAIRYLSRAGYDPLAMARFLAKLRAHSRLEAEIAGKSPDSVDRFNYLATHPAPQARVTRAASEAKGLDTARSMTARDTYLGKIDGMIYGGSPEQGFARGRDFIHPALRFRFTVPEGFRLRNAPSAVTAEGPDSSLIVFDMARDAGWRSTYSYLTSVWAKGARLERVRGITVNRLEGTEGFTRINTRRGPADLWLVAIRGARERIYRFVFASPSGRTARPRRGFEATLGSFRRIGAAEAASVKPRRLKIVRVRRGETQRAIAARMAVSRRALARFRVLNGLGPGDRLRPGRRVKIVIE